MNRNENGAIWIAVRVKRASSTNAPDATKRARLCGWELGKK